MPQEFNCNIFQTVYQVLTYNAGYHGIPRKQAEERANELMEVLGLTAHRDKATRGLSGGMKRRLMIGRALIHNPKLLLLDEPTTGVDVKLRQQTWDLLKKMNKLGITIVLTTHYLEEAEALCDNIAILHKGKIQKQGKLNEMIEQHKPSARYIIYYKGDIERVKSKVHLEPGIVEGQVILTVSEKQSLAQCLSLLAQYNIEILGLRTERPPLETMLINETNQ